MPDYDVIVIGVGGMGSATLYHLARRGARVLGIERFDIPHELGSSHGVSRIIRMAYFEDPAYVPLVRRAYELWRELERTAGERLLFITGGIDAGAEGSEVVQGSLRACREHRLAHELLDAASLQKRCPAYRLPRDFLAVYQPDGGFLLSERCVVAHVTAARTLGADVHTQEPVIEWSADAEGVSVRTDRASYRGSKLVITGGAWAGRLIPILADRLVPERQVVIWTQPLRPEYFQPEAFPVFVLDAPEGKFYGCPIYEIPGVKLGKHHHRGERVDPDRMDRACHPEDEALVREAIRRYLPDADGPTLALKPCLYTNSPDGHFIIDFHPDAARVCLAAGFSGHGFKFSPVVGEIMADLALDGGTAWDLSLFGFQRLTRV